MSIKERPLIKSVEKLGPLPGFLFSNPYLAGFTAVSGCVLFGAVFMLFWVGILGGGNALGIYQSVRSGSMAGLAIAGLLLVVTAYREVDGPEEKFDRIKFVLGGVGAIVIIVLFDMLTFDFLTEYLAGVGEIFCTSQVPGCQ